MTGKRNPGYDSPGGKPGPKKRASHASQKVTIEGRIRTAVEPYVGPVKAQALAEWVTNGYPWPEFRESAGSAGSGTEAL